jgi:hypothetical protein
MPGTVWARSRSPRSAAMAEENGVPGVIIEVLDRDEQVVNGREGPAFWG